MTVTTDELPASAQTLRRGLSILRLLARSHSGGLRMSDIVRRLSLTKATAVRLTQALLSEGFVVQDPSTNRYRLGPETFAIGLAAEPDYALQRIAAPALHSLALSTGDWTCFSIRTSDEVVCLSVEKGNEQLPPSILRTGDRYPLGISSAGLAILAALPDDEIEQILSRKAKTISSHFPESAPQIPRQIEETRARGYSLIPGLLLPGYWAMAVALRQEGGTPIAAISLVAHEARLTPMRRGILGERMRSLAAELMATAQERQSDLFRG